MPLPDTTLLLATTGLSEYLLEVEERLVAGLKGATASIREPALRVMRARSKRMRPALVFAVAATGQTPKEHQVILAAGAAVELIHVASLVHDDIIDDSNSRRGVLTINSQEGAKQAIVIGDYLLAAAYAQAADIATEAVDILAATTTVLCEGESQELADRYNLNRSQASLIQTMRGKTAALFAAACQLGAMCGGFDTETIRIFGQYGEELGMAFQYIDDVLDLVSNATLSGKPIGNDIAEGVYTLPVLLAIQGGQGEVVKQLLTQRHRRVGSLLRLLIDEGTITQTLRRARVHNQAATQALQGIKASGSLAGLSQLPSAYMQWALANLVAERYQSIVADFL